LKAVRGEGEVVVPAEDGYRNMEVAERIKREIYRRIRRVQENEDTGS